MEQSPSWEADRYSGIQEIPPSLYGIQSFIAVNHQIPQKAVNSSPMH
jgi:hypothetical protein